MTEPAAFAMNDDLLARAAALRAGAGPLDDRTVAGRLGVPEAALLEARCEEGGALRLAPSAGPEGFGALFPGLPALGEIRAVCRNATCVHEKIGVLPEPAIDGPIGMTVGAIDLRLFFQHWRFGYAVTEATGDSLQFFDASGGHILRIDSGPQTDRVAFADLVTAFASPHIPAACFAPSVVAPVEQPDSSIDVEGLRAAWREQRQTNLFFSLMKRFSVTRAQAMRLVGADLARPVAPSSVATLLHGVAEAGIPILAFCGNRGCLQIHAGPICTVLATPPMLAVRDKAFTLTLDERGVTSAFVVRKPSVQGDVHSLELYDASAEVVLQIFGDRPPQGPERADWRALTASLPDA